MSRTKDPSVFTDESAVLTEARNAYRNASLEMTKSLLAFKFTAKKIVPYHMLILLEDHVVYHEQSTAALAGIQAAVSKLESSINEVHGAYLEEERMRSSSCGLRRVR